MRSMALAGTVVGVVCFVLIARAQAVLVGRWLLDDETAAAGTVPNAASPGTGDGTLNGDAYTSGGMLHLDGVGDRVEILDDAIFSGFESGNKLTIAAWVKPDTLSGRPTIFSTRVNNAAGSFQFEAGTGSGGSHTIAVTTPGIWNAQAQNNVLTAGQWSHVAYTKDGTTQKLYVNGVEQTLVTDDPRTFQDNGDAKLIGAGTLLQASHDFKGLMRDVTIYDEALLPAQFMTGFSLPGDAYAQAVLADNPTQYWRLGETSGTRAVNIASSIDGTYNGPTLGQAGPRPSLYPGLESDNKAPDFDGTDDRVESNSALATMTQWTLEAWAKPDVLEHSKTILTNDRGGYNDDVLFGLAPETAGHSPANRWAVIHQESTTHNRTIVSNPVDLSADQWYHVVATSDGDELCLYVNGQLTGSQARQGDDLDFARATTWIGANPNGIIRFFDGTLDEVAVYDRALGADEVLHHFDTAAGYSTTGRVVPANIQVIGGASDTVWSVAQTSAVGLGVNPTDNYADTMISVGGLKALYTDGVLMATIRENGRDDGTGTMQYGTVEVAFPSGFSGEDTLSLATSRAGAGQGGELNINVAAAWFPFDGGWTGGHVDASGSLAAAAGVTQSDLTHLSGGHYELRIPDVDAANDGMLFVEGGSNSNRIVTTELLPNDAGWNINVKSNTSNHGDSLQDDFSFVYVPYWAYGLVGGRVDNDAAGTVLNSVGDFTLAAQDGGQNSTFRLSIPGESPETGVLLLTVLDNPGSNYILPDDNIISYEADGTDFIIQVRDLTGLTLESPGAGFVFAFISFDDPLFVPEPSTMVLLAAGLGLLFGCRRRRKT